MKMQTTRLLHLHERSSPEQSEELLSCIALSLPEQDRDGILQRLTVLSPRVMHWANDIWLIDMQTCRLFWQQLARSQQRTVRDLLCEEIERSAAGSYTACSAPTPWQALLLLRLLCERKTPGLVSFQSRLGRNLYRQLSWDLWWQSAAEYAELSGIKRPLFAKQQRAMALAVQRLGSQRPEQLRSMPAAQIQRRYGKTMAEVWSLSFPDAQGIKLKDAQTLLFPWRVERLPEQVRIQRHLDFGLKDWPEIEELLREDLNRLCVLDSFKNGESILGLEWNIVLCNLHKTPVKIPFRHPYSLHQDAPLQRTALLQIQYAYQHIMKMKNIEESQRIVSWELCVTEKLPPRQRQGTLFQDSGDDARALEQLENLLKKPLEFYSLQEDWLAEDSFVHDELSSLCEQTTELSESAAAIHCLARQRPLFLYKEPRPLELTHQPDALLFQERTMDKWWRKNDLMQQSRDYFKLLIEQHWLWVYRNAGGSWIMQGVYA